MSVDAGISGVVFLCGMGLGVAAGVLLVVLMLLLVGVSSKPRSPSARRAKDAPGWKRI